MPSSDPAVDAAPLTLEAPGARHVPDPTTALDAHDARIEVCKVLHPLRLTA